MIKKTGIAIIVLLIVAIITIGIVGLPRHTSLPAPNYTSSNVNASVNSSIYEINLTGKHTLTFSSANYSLVFYNGTITNATYYPIYLFNYPIPVNIVNGTELIPSISMNDELKWQLQSFGATFGENYTVLGTPIFTSNGLANYIAEAIYTPNSTEIRAYVYTKAGNWSIYTNGYNFMVANGSYIILGFDDVPNYKASELNATESAFFIPQSSPNFPRKYLPILNNLTNSIGIPSTNKIWFVQTTYYFVRFNPEPIPPTFFLWAPNTTNVTS